MIKQLVRRDPPPARPTPGVEQVLVVAGIPDHLNRNLQILDCVREAFAARLGAAGVLTAPLSHAVERVAEMQNGAVVLFGTAMPDQTDFHAIAHTARQRGFPVVVWLTDDPYEFDVGYKFTDVADLIFTNDRWSAAYYNRPGVFHLPTAASRTRHRRAILERNDEYTFDIFFCGVGFANRQAIIDGLRPVLSRHDTLICGDGWQENAPYVQNRRLSNDELMEYYRRSRIVLNLARDHSYANDRYKIIPSTPGPRTFEAAMAGAFQMIFADRPEIMEYYALDREIVMFSGLADFETKVERFLSDPAARLAVARAAQERTLRDHQYEHRVDVILNALAAGADDDVTESAARSPPHRRTTCRPA